MSAAEQGAGPGTHYELFRGLREARVAYVLTGAAALVLHGVPRLTPCIELTVAPDAENVARLERLLAAWGYGEAGRGAGGNDGAAVRRFRHPFAALGEIDVGSPLPEEFARLRVGSAVATLVELDIPFVGASDLRAIKEHSGAPADREDAASLRLLAALRAGNDSGGSADEIHREQIRKFSRWSVAARLDWLLAAARLDKGMSPEARPMTRGLTRRRPWTERRG